VAVVLETARQEWTEATRRIEQARNNRDRYRRLLAQVDIVAAELRRRVGQTFTLGELADAYGSAEDWAREAVGERAPTPDWPRDIAIVTAAAFDSYQRGAIDYAP
jgi:hypothetical protein